MDRRKRLHNGLLTKRVAPSPCDSLYPGVDQILSVQGQTKTRFDSLTDFLRRNIHGHNACKNGWNGINQEISDHRQAHTNEHTAYGRANDAAQSPNAYWPANARGAELGRIKAGRNGIQPHKTTLMPKPSSPNISSRNDEPINSLRPPSKRPSISEKCL